MTDRNKPCPCGSGKKYKHCCYKTKPKLDLSEIDNSNIRLFTFAGMTPLTVSMILEISARWNRPDLEEQLLSIVPVCEHGYRQAFYCQDRDSIFFSVDDDSCEVSQNEIKLHGLLDYLLEPPNTASSGRGYQRAKRRAGSGRRAA